MGNVGSVIRVMLAAVVVAASLSGLTCTTAKSTIPPLYSVAELPVEKFDQYPAGGPPPAPWQILGAPAGVKVRLDKNAESPFINNTVSGVGVIFAGPGAGLGYDFAPPPPGEFFAGFDFYIDDAATTVLPTVSFKGDDAAPAWALRLYQQGRLGWLDPHGGFQPLADIKPQTWYHLALKANSAGGRGYLGLIAHVPGRHWDYYLNLTSQPSEPNGRKYDIWRELTLPPLGSARRLEFINQGALEATGTWRLDNVLLAGQVDTPRAGWWPIDPPPLATLRQSPKKAFAYYFSVYSNNYGCQDPGTDFINRTTLNPVRMVWESPLTDYAKEGYAGYTLYQALPHVPQPSADEDRCRSKGMEEEVRLARQLGLDGFLVDFWARPDPKNGQPLFSKNAFALLEAAHRVDSEFKIALAFYGFNEKDGVNGEADEGCDPHEYAASPLLRQALKHPSAYRLPDGRTVLSMWLAERHSLKWWNTVIADLQQAGLPVAFVPHFNTLHRLAEFAPISYGMAHWGPRTPAWDYDWVQTIRQFRGPLAVSPVASQDARPRNCCVWEAAGSEAFRSQWESAIRQGSDWVVLNTWNDYSEQAQMPSTRIGFSFYDLNAYYITWFKTGQPPAIKRDVLYYFYRRHHTETPHTMGKDWVFSLYNPKTGDHAPRNQIELLAFLTAPGKLSIRAGSQTYTQDAPAGVTSFSVPLPKHGEIQPEFGLERGGRTVLSGTGQYLITDRIVFPDLLYNSGVIAKGGTR